MNWTVKIHRKAEKQVASLSRKVAEKLQFLIADIIKWAGAWYLAELIKAT